MNRKRLGQVLIGGVFTVCGLVIAALAELVAKEEKKEEGRGESRPDAGGAVRPPRAEE